MKTGTKSLLFGVHQLFWHPIVVYIAWLFMYGQPSFKELICIFIHDWGYIGKPNLDGKEGLLHPELGAKIARTLFGDKYYYLCAGHSRSYSKLINIEPSKLCWADKLAFVFDPMAFYLLRAKLSGELTEIRHYGLNNEIIDLDASNKAWFETTIKYTLNIPEIEKLIEYSQKIHPKISKIIFKKYINYEGSKILWKKEK